MTDPAITPEAQAMATVAAAVAGPDTPNSAQVVAKPQPKLVWALFLAGPVVTLFVFIPLWVIGPAPWPLPEAWAAGLPRWPEAAADIRIKALAALGLAGWAVLLVIVFRLASGGLKEISASAGPGSVTLKTGDDE